MSLPAETLSTLNFMRSISTVLVVGIHYLGMNGHLPGPLGALPRIIVLAFLVHTGFVLMLSLERQRAASAQGLWWRFMVRRSFRIYPLSLLVLALIIVFRIPSQIVPPDFHYLELGDVAILSNLLLTMNLTASLPLLSPLWSLPYEFQLYVLLPALFLYVDRWRTPMPAFALWGVCVAIASLQPRLPHGGRLDILEYLPCMVSGLLAYRLAKSVRPRLPFFLWAVLFGGFLCFGLLMPNPESWPAAWTTCLLTGISAPFFRQTSSALLRNACQWIAQRSYAIYLTHYFCLWAAFRANHFPLPAQGAIFAAAMVALPAALYRVVETPMIHVGRRLTSDGPATIAALGAPAVH